MNLRRIGKILKNDYVSFLLAISGPIALITWGSAALFGFLPPIGGRVGRSIDPKFATGLFVGASGITVLLFVFLVLRVVRLKRIVQTGARVAASVTQVEFFKDRGRIDFPYVHEGQRYAKAVAVMKNKDTEAFTEGLEIEVAVDPANPKNAMIVSLYS